MKKKILIITTAFAPENEIGAVRLSKLAKYLVRLGMNVTVISPELHKQSKVDPEMEETEFKKITRIQIPQSNYFTKTFLSRRNSLLEKGSTNSYLKTSSNASSLKLFKVKLYRIIQYLYMLLRNYDWKRKVISFAKSKYQKNQFDIVLSSYPSVGAHWAALKIKKRKIAQTWVADFRDPINYSISTNKLKYFLNSQVQQRIVKNANLVTYISKDLLFKFPKKFRHKFHFLVNGFDEEDRKHLVQYEQDKDNPKLRFCYVGSLYGGERKLDVIFKALNELASEKRVNSENVEFVYAGKEFHVLQKQASDYDVTECLVNKGVVSRKESLNIQQNSDLVVVSTWNTKKDKGIITGKLFEAFLTRRNILGAVSGTVPNSEFKRIIDDVNGGFVIEEGSHSFDMDYQKLKYFLEKLYKKKVENGFVEGNYNDKLDYYSYYSISQRLIDLFR